MALFESYDRRINQINAELAKHGISSIEEAKEICDKAGVDAYNIVKGIQPICFENAAWAYVVGSAIAIKDQVKSAAEAAAALAAKQEKLDAAILNQEKLLAEICEVLKKK